MTTINKKKILIISLNIPYPLAHGGAIAQYYFLKNLSIYHDITFCSFAENEDELQNLTILARKIPDIKIIYHYKRNNYSDGPFIDFLRNIYFKFRQKRVNRDSNHSISSVLKLIDSEFVTFLVKHLEQNSYDIFQLEFFETLSLVAILPPSSKKIFINHEILSRNLGLSNPDVSNKQNQAYIVPTIRAVERIFLNSFNKIVVFSEEDKIYLKNLDPDILTSPFGIPDELITRTTSSEKFTRFVFLGSELHQANKEGLKWFLDHVYVPNNSNIDWPLFISGIWSKDFREEYKENPKIIFTGFVSDLNPLFDESILINPIISGSGIRTKILQAFVNMVPVLSTAQGCEGLLHEFSSNQHLLQFSNEKDFLQIFEMIKNNNTYLRKVIENAHQFYHSNFATSSVLSKRNEAYF